MLEAMMPTAVAITAGSISLLGLVISKEQKISEFRQSWIDGLRNDIALIIAHANAIHGASMNQSSNAADAWMAVRPDFLGVNEAAARVRLRLNGGELPSKSVLETLEQINRLFSVGRRIDYQALDVLEDQLVEET